MKAERGDYVKLLHKTLLSWESLSEQELNNLLILLLEDYLERRPNG